MKRLNRITTDKARLYPERIIQFGEGNFLRAFVDWIVYSMNREGGFDAGVVVVQPLPSGMIDTLNEQAGLYHLNLQGIDKGRQVNDIELIDVVTRGINPYHQFDEYMELAENPDIRFVVSNTTEAGIAFDDSCNRDDRPAVSYPGKLTQLLYHRYETFGGAKDKGWIILPCELIFHNGTELKNCIYRYIDLWELGDGFKDWFNTTCGVYNTLVDRIVPGYPKDTIDAIQNQIGVEDRLVVKAEIFHLWVIEAPDSVAEEFPANKAGLNVLFVPDEKPYHVRKVTLLNGSHTALSPVGFLSGLDTVCECVGHEVIGAYIRKVMFDELLPTLDMPKVELEEYAKDILERFGNPYVKHYLTSIMLNSFPKFKVRDLPALKAYQAREGKLPQGLVLGLAALITYYKGGKRNDDVIVPDDDQMILSFLSQLWQNEDMAEIAKAVLGALFIWEEDLNLIPGLTDTLTYCLQSIKDKGMLEAVKAYIV